MGYVKLFKRELIYTTADTGGRLNSAWKGIKVDNGRSVTSRWSVADIMGYVKLSKREHNCWRSGSFKLSLEWDWGG